VLKTEIVERIVTKKCFDAVLINGNFLEKFTKNGIYRSIYWCCMGKGNSASERLAGTESLRVPPTTAVRADDACFVGEIYTL